MVSLVWLKFTTECFGQQDSDTEACKSAKNDFAPLMYYDTKDLLRENDKNGRGHGEITTPLFFLGTPL